MMRPNGRARSGWVYRFRGVLIVFAVVLVTASTAVALAALGDSGIENAPESGDGGQRVRTDGERCAIPLMDGWEWRPASWSLVSPQGTTVGFYESLHGRPQYPEWEEAIDEVAGRYEDRDDVTIERSDTTLRIDFGQNGGLSVIQRFDRVGCHLTFSPPSSDVRASEIDDWQRLIDSVERTFPQGRYFDEHRRSQITGRM